MGKVLGTLYDEFKVAAIGVASTASHKGAHAVMVNPVGLSAEKIPVLNGARHQVSERGTASAAAAILKVSRQQPI